MDFDVIIIGGGHAGCEAAYTVSRFGLSVMMIALKKECIGALSCNCSIGGPGKAHLVREIAAFGGVMPKIADQTVTHRRLINTSKGPAVHALRVQVDKDLYPQFMQNFLGNIPNITILEAEVAEILAENGNFEGVILTDGSKITAKKGIITTGTFLNGVTFVGDTTKPEGRYGEPPATKLSQSLIDHGFKLGRLKTGTTPRIAVESIDYDECDLQPSDNIERTYEFDWQEPKLPERELMPCHLTYTTEETHQIIRDNLNRSALYGGLIVGKGPRYCPSIEDKIVRFADRDRHQIFLEREGWQSNTVYPMGISTSLPADVQEAFVHSIPGLKNAEIVRYGYAVEYDFIHPFQLNATLHTKQMFGLYTAGQVNGTSGYEEAAAQGLIAGLNAALSITAQAQYIPGREVGYIGVLLDDLVTKELTEPYRLLTSRAEYRLLFRQDNADSRLTRTAQKFGIIPDADFARFSEKMAAISAEIERMNSSSPNDIGLKGVVVHKVADWLKRPEISYDNLREFDEVSRKHSYWVGAEVDVAIKYDGYIRREVERIERQEDLEGRAIPIGFDFRSVNGLSNETLHHLERVQPQTLGQASRIAGITPSDILLLSVHLRRNALRD